MSNPLEINPNNGFITEMFYEYGKENLKEIQITK